MRQTHAAHLHESNISENIRRLQSTQSQISIFIGYKWQLPQPNGMLRESE